MDNRGQLLNDLQRSCGVEDREVAERLAGSVLHLLHDRLGPEAEHLAAQLPHDVKPLYEGSTLARLTGALTPRDKFDFEQMVERVASEVEVDTELAREATIAVFSQLKAHVSEGEARHVSAVLPHDIQDAWQRA